MVNGALIIGFSFKSNFIINGFIWICYKICYYCTIINLTPMHYIKFYYTGFVQGKYYHNHLFMFRVPDLSSAKACIQAYSVEGYVKAAWFVINDEGLETTEMRLRIVRNSNA